MPNTESLGGERGERGDRESGERERGGEKGERRVRLGERLRKRGGREREGKERERKSERREVFQLSPHKRPFPEEDFAANKEGGSDVFRPKSRQGKQRTILLATMQQAKQLVLPHRLLAENFAICPIVNGLWQVSGGHGSIDYDKALESVHTPPHRPSHNQSIDANISTLNFIKYRCGIMCKRAIQHLTVLIIM